MELQYQSRGLSLKGCAGTAIASATGFILCFWVYSQYNLTDVTMLEESARSLNIFASVPLLFLPSLAPQLQQKTDKLAPCRSQMICFLSWFLSGWRERSSAHRILPARQVQLDTAISVVSLCCVQLCSPSEVVHLGAGEDQTCVSFFLLGAQFKFLEECALHRQSEKRKRSQSQLEKCAPRSLILCEEII